MHGPEIGELLPEMLDLVFGLRDGLHIRYHCSDIGYCQVLSLKIPNFPVFSSALAIHSLVAAAIRVTIPP
jgi:hypothetical protein